MFCFVPLDDTTLTDLWNMHPEALWTVCLWLDGHTRNVKNWMDLGSEIGLSTTILRNFSYSPSKDILEMIGKRHPNIPITNIQTVLRRLDLAPAESKLDPLRGNKKIMKIKKIYLNVFQLSNENISAHSFMNDLLGSVLEFLHF